MTLSPPSDLGQRGQALWDALTELHDLSPDQHVNLTEACRTADRLDLLDAAIRGKGLEGLLHLRRMDGEGDITVKVDDLLTKSATLQTVLKQLLAAMRLPDEASGKRPQQRGGARGAYKPSGKTSARDRLKAV